MKQATDETRMIAWPDTFPRAEGDTPPHVNYYRFTRTGILSIPNFAYDGGSLSSLANHAASNCGVNSTGFSLASS
jgi:hypothetical protein